MVIKVHNYSANHWMPIHEAFYSNSDAVSTLQAFTKVIPFKGILFYTLQKKALGLHTYPGKLFCLPQPILSTKCLPLQLYLDYWGTILFLRKPFQRYKSLLDEFFVHRVCDTAACPCSFALPNKHLPVFKLAFTESSRMYFECWELIKFREGSLQRKKSFFALWVSARHKEYIS